MQILTFESFDFVIVESLGVGAEKLLDWVACTEWPLTNSPLVAVFLLFLDIYENYLHLFPEIIVGAFCVLEGLVFSSI